MCEILMFYKEYNLLYMYCYVFVLVVRFQSKRKEISQSDLPYMQGAVLTEMLLM